MEKENYCTRMEPIMLDTLQRAMQMDKVGSLVPMDGYIKGNWRISRLKGKEYFTISH